MENDKRYEKFDFSNKQKGRGGARPGSGRKATGRKTKCLTITLTEEQAEVLQEKAKYAHLTVSQFIVKELNLPYKTEISGTASSAAAEGVGALKSAAKSQIVKSVS